MYKCDYADKIKNGMCARMRRSCNGIFEEEKYFGRDELETMEMKAVCKNGSPYGNYYFLLTDADIETIKNGKVLGTRDEEYNIFIAYKGETE